MASVFTESLVGRVLDGRYRLRDLIGVGGSARVYRAEDSRLKRYVAVKVLHASFADDDGFVRRFKREAEALATLTHPNIVRVYDVNDGANAAGDPPYLVTEHLGGGTLLDLLESGYRLSVAQAARLGLETARGLEFAHARGLVHRDIKPANLLFGEDQHVRIADFGLATVLADFGRTVQGNAPLGSPRYQSPEQARPLSGVPLDGRSDVYALALVLIEAVTGSVPFTAETWTGLALARLDGGLRAPAVLGDLAPIVNAAGTLEPEDRLDATGLVRALDTLVRGLPRAEPLPLDGSRLASRAAFDSEPTRHAGLRDSAPLDVVIDLKEEPKAVPAEESKANVVARKGGVFDISLDEPGTATSKKAASTVDPKRRRFGRKRTSQGVTAKQPRRWVRAVVGAILACAVAVGAAVFAISQRTPTHLVPMLAGRSVSDAAKEAGALKFVVRTADEVFDTDVEQGAVISQAPAAGARLKEQSEITLIVSKGVEPVTVPDLSGLSFDAASGALRALNLRIGQPALSESSDSVAEGSVLRWAPSGSIAPGSVVTVVVSSGPATVIVPKLVGMTEEEALGALPPTLVSEIGRQASDAPKGTVFSTSPKAGDVVPKGTTVKIAVSTGPAFVVVPNVINLLPADAIAQLRAAGFKIGNTIGPADQPVLHTRPLRNTKQRKGATVTLYTTDLDVPEVPGVAATQTSAPPTNPASNAPAASVLAPAPAAVPANP